MNRTAQGIFCLVSFVMLANFSSQNSVDGHQKNKINFCGTLTDIQGNTLDIDNISIAGSYDRIPVYQKPTNPDTKPDINTTRIDLQEVAAIKLPSPEPVISKFKNREYIDIVIVSNDAQRTEKQYIIDLNRKILCDELNDAGPIEKEISFQALGNLEINGYTYRDPENKGRKGTCKS
jgi:hypothetical protein